MMPVFRDSCPHQRNQVPFAQYCYPSYDGISPQMMVGQSRPPIMYESQPHGYNYGYSIPRHGCCDHGNFPGFYGFRPDFFHFSPTPPSYCCGLHPPLPEPYPLQYAHPPHHAMKQWKYEYDKDARRDFHCCGCPNHISNSKNDKGVIIEEQEPDVVKKSDLLVPVQSKNYLHPTVWIPPEYAITSDEHRRPFESVVAEQEKVPRNKMSHENVKCSEGEPRLWNGQFPLDMNSLKSLMQGEDEKGKQNQQIEEGIRPHPIIWKPSNNEQREPERKDQRNVSIWFPLDMNSLKSLMEVEDEKRKQNQHNEDGMRKFSHPIIWMPPKNEQREPEKDQRNMNSWFPVDLNSLKSLMQGEDEKRMEKQQNEDKMRQYPYPIIWMPFKSELGEAEKKDRREMNAAPTSAEEPSSGFKFAQVKPSECVGVKKSETSKENHCGQVTRSQMTESTGNHKIIPVKQMEVHTEEDNSEGAKQKVAADNSSGTNKKRHSSSLPKASKLPPVSLRLEPFPGKKNCNDNSRSPSPPGLKRQSQGDTPKPSASSSSIEKTPEGMQSPYASLKMSEENPKKSEQKGIDMVDIDAWENKNEHLRNGAEMENSAKLSIGSQEVVTGKSSTETTGKDSNRCGLREDKGVVCERDMTVKGATKELVKLNDPAESVGGERKAKKKNFSDIQAAALIQSAYRGFEVRKLEPLKKLKQMAEVRQQVAEVRNRIQALESSTDLQKYDKEEVLIGEMIMRLLLKLDTIQGLHPSLRDIRKALAKDLVTLQEELDSLTMKSKGLSEEVTAAKVVIDPSIETRDDLGMQEMQNNDVGNLENSPGTSHDNCVNKKEQDQSKLLNMVDLSSNYQGQEPSEPARGDKEVNERCEQEMKKELPERNCVESQVGESSADRVRDKTANGKVDVSQAVMTEIQEGYDMHPQPQQCARLPLISEEKTSSQKLTGAQLRESCCAPSGENEAAVGRVNGAINVEDNPEAESTELPLKMIDEEPSGCELKNDEPAGKGKTEIVDAEIKSNMLAGPTLPAEVDNINEVEKAIASNVDPEATLVAELPIGVLEEDLAGPTLPAEVDNIDEVEKAIASNVNPEANLVAELPIGVPEEDSFVDNKQIETGKAGPTLPTEVDNMNEVEKEIVTNITQETNLVPELPIGVLKEDLAVDNKQMETGEELSSMEARYKLVTNTTSPTESNDMLKVMVEELPGNAVLDMEENSPLSSIKGGERSNDEDKDSGMVDVDQMPSLESAVVSVANESEETKEDQQQKVADGIKEEDLVEKKSQCLELESVIDTDKMDEPNGSEITSHSRMSVDRKDIVMEGNKKLIEENIKLREMMEKLMEAGKEQSTVISHLTGRVKDLERKLSRKKKLRARRNKRATPAISSK